MTPNSDKCRILVDGVPCVWRDGEAFMFDETFIHSAENATDVNRIILFCDVERPMKLVFMTAMNRWVSHHIVKASSTQNVEGEHAARSTRCSASSMRFTSPAARSRSGTARSTTR